MKILGIETSCDETAVCLIDAHGDYDADFRFEILGNALYSQVAVHAPYGGVFPNLAKREHARNLVPLFEKVLRDAHELNEEYTDISVYRNHLQSLLSREPDLLDALIRFLATYKKPSIDVIAVTHGPGLEPALWVGINFAKALSITWNIPLVTVNHMEGHVVLSAVEDNAIRTLAYPALALLISGGHTELVLSREWMHYERIGETRDDAVGEAFDKVARLLGLPYPGGPQVSKLADEARERSLERHFKLTRPMLTSDDYDFSFAGLKTAVRRIVEMKQNLSDDERLALAREFEDTVADVLVAKTLAAIEEYGAQSVIVGGGVAANRYIRERLAQAATKIEYSVELRIPPPIHATDNALMIATAGYFHALKNHFADPNTVRAQGTLRLA